MEKYETDSIKQVHKNLSEMAHDLATLMLQTDSTEMEDGKLVSYHIDWTDHEIMAATLIFVSMITNRHNKSLDKDISTEEKTDIARTFAEEIRDFVKRYTGIDTTKYYKDK